jgi:hypothetical protein
VFYSYCSLFEISCIVSFRVKDTVVFMFANGFPYFGRGPPREGDRPRYGDRDGYRAGPRAAPGDFTGEKGGAPGDFQPSFRVRALLTFQIVGVDINFCVVNACN